MTRLIKHCVSLLGISCLSVCLGLPVKAHAKDKITWYTTDWAPFYMTRGKQKRKGINDRLLKYIHQFLPEYELETQNMNAAFLEKAFEAGDNVCQLDMFKTPKREAMAYFSKYPSIIDAPLRLFVRAKDEERLGLVAPVKIDVLLNDKRFKADFVKSRSYNTLIDTALQSNKNEHVAREESTKRIIKDFFKGKTDYVVEYSAVMSYLKSVFKFDDGLYSFPIKDTEPFVLGYVGCSKTLWGKTVIEAIDVVLKAHRHDPEYKEILELWHDDRSRQVLVDNYQHF